ncbi:MAG: type II secretion system F family protein [Patescibacteria group bacterium]|nr:type II secretion system F family protein [Patescibacteria group bacterium]MDD4610839.1 type II secretion system F family protein [Patescibacteria group bacterium]
MPKTQDTQDNKNERLIKKKWNFVFTFRSVPLKEKLFFTQYLKLMLKSGISISSAIKVLGKQNENKYFSKILAKIYESVDKGVSLTESLKPHEKVFGELYVNMIGAGETSGKLEEVLDQLYIQMKKQYELSLKVKGALAYPAIIILAMFGVGVFLMIYVMPVLVSTYSDLRASLPWSTRVLINFSDFISNHGILALVVLVFAIFALQQTYHNLRGKYFIQGLILKMPVISPIIKKINIAHFSRTLSSLLKTDVMVVKTFQITANTLGNLHYRRAVNDMAEMIKKGSRINEIISNYPQLFPPVVNQIILVGEETGELDNILSELADFYESEVENIMNDLPSVIEPLIILLLGLGVGIIATAIVMPIYGLAQIM